VAREGRLWEEGSVLRRTYPVASSWNECPGSTLGDGV